MKHKKILALFLVSLFLIMSLTGCGQKTETSSDEKPTTQYVTIVTGSTGGTYYPVGTIFSTLWNEKLGDQGVVASVQSSGGSVENLNMLKSGEAQLGIAMANLTLFAHEGEGKFEGNQFEDVRFVTALWPDVTQFVVTEGSGINSISDFKGQKINVGGAGSGTEYSCKLIFEHVGGLTFDDVNTEHLGYFEASSAMQNGQLDGMNAEGGLPTSAVSEIFASKTPVKMLEFSDADYEKLHKIAPYYGQFTVPGGLYSKLDKDVKTVGIKSALIASADLDEDLVYELVKSIYESYDEIASSHKALEFVKLEEAIKGLPPVPLHPGAVRYYQEKGIEIPEELLP
ncbi:TAXI family TRAP transporter solute-binding subunit [Clostridiaceae bacterium 35-E11]